MATERQRNMPLEMQHTLGAFRIWPGRGQWFRERSRHFDVQVFRTRRELIRAWEEFGHPDIYRCAAAVVPLRRIRGHAKHLGFASFCKSHLREEIIVHECLHMAAAYMRATNPKAANLSRDHDDYSEENMAFAVSNIYAQVTRGLKRF